MIDTDTADVDSTFRQVAALANARSELVRITVHRDEAAAAVAHIRDKPRQMGVLVPRDDPVLPRKHQKAAKRFERANGMFTGRWKDPRCFCELPAF